MPLHYRATKHFHDGTTLDVLLHNGDDLLRFFDQVESLEAGDQIAIDALEMICPECTERERESRAGQTWMCESYDERLWREAEERWPELKKYTTGRKRGST